MGSPDPRAMLNVTKNGNVAGGTQATAAAGLDLARFLQAELRPVAELESAIKVLAGTFYRTEDPTRHGTADALYYYRQREWRTLANTVGLGRPADVGLPAELASALLALDPDFFGRSLSFPGGAKRVVDGCSLLPRVAGRHALGVASRLIVPAEAAASAACGAGAFAKTSRPPCSSTGGVFGCRAKGLGTLITGTLSRGDCCGGAGASASGA